MKYEELNDEMRVLRKLLFKGRLGFRLLEEEKNLIKKLKQRHLEGSNIELSKDEDELLNGLIKKYCVKSKAGKQKFMENNKNKFLKEVVGWGVGLWAIGYVLGIIVFMVVPVGMIGWVVSPIGILITLWVLMKKIDGVDMMYYLKIAVAWTIIAIVLDYFLLVKLFNPADGYYKFDVYFYYFTTFVLPLLVGIFKTRKPKITI